MRRRARIKEIETHGVRKSVPPPPEPVAAIYHPVETVRADSPSEKELRELRRICARDYPAWCSSDDYVWAGRGPPDKEACEAEWYLQFSRSILALSAMRKLDKPDAKRYAGDFVEHAQTLLRSIGKYTKELRSAPFFMACFCMGVPIAG